MKSARPAIDGVRPDGVADLPRQRLVVERSANPSAGKKASPGTPAHDDLVRRDFTADAPNLLWLADITEHRTGEGKLYCCAIKDVFSNRIVGWAIDRRMKARLVVAAIEMAVARRGDVAGCILHSDRGSQFRSRKVAPRPGPPRHGRLHGPSRLRRRQRRHGIVLRPPAKNVLDRHRWTTRDELRIAIVTWIERTYHRRRRQAALGRLTPIEYETIMTTPADARPPDPTCHPITRQSHL